MNGSLWVFVVEIAIRVVFISFLILMIWSGFKSSRAGAPYVPMFWWNLKPILSFAEPRSDDIFYDLGCGDGRILITAARKFSVKNCRGYDISAWPRVKARIMAKLAGVSNKVQIKKANIFQADIHDASLVYMYLFPEITNKLATKISKECRPGTRVVVPVFAIEHATIPNLELKKEAKLGKMPVYLYEVI